VVGVTALGLAVGAGGLYRAATAEPLQVPLIPVALSQPKGEQPNWTASGGRVVPTTGLLPPQPAEPAPEPRPVLTYELAPPARPSNSAGAVQPAPLPQPVFNLQSADPGHSVESGGTPAGPQAPPAAAELAPPPVFQPPGGVSAPTPPPAPGDAQMTRQLVMSAVFGAALAAAPLTPVAAQDEKKGQTDTGKKDDVADIKKQLEDIKRDIQSLQTFRKNLEDEVFGKSDGKTLAEMGLIKRLTEIETKLNRIETALNQISGRVGDPSKSTSAFGPPVPGAVVGKAFVRIVNEYPTEMSMLVNGRAYRVLPGQTATVEVPPGGYTYELLHSGAQPVTSTVKDGETVTLRIR
jgi:hypothetical protein